MRLHLTPSLAYNGTGKFLASGAPDASPIASGDTVGVELVYLRDPAAWYVAFSHNGVDCGIKYVSKANPVLTRRTASFNICPAVCVHNGRATQLNVNFGDRPFKSARLESARLR